MRPVYLLIAVFVFAADQVSKWMIVARFSAETMVPVIPGFFNLVRTQNRGIAFGMLSGVSSSMTFMLILLFSAVALGVICYLLWTGDPSARRAGTALALILGGAGGNIADRLVRGSVVDFLDFYVGTYHWYTFNIADSAIVIGASLLIIDQFWGRSIAPSKTPSESCATEPRP